MALVNAGPTYPSIHPFIHPSIHAFIPVFVFLQSMFFPKANPFSSRAWNDCINPLAGILQPTIFLTSRQSVHHLAYSHWQKKPHFFLSCATGDLKQVLGTCGFWVGYFSIIGAILLDACDIISSQVLLGSLLVGNQLDGKKVMDDVVFRNFLLLLFFFFLDMFPPKHASLGRVIQVMLDRRTSNVFHPL
jgi:hypothetical protein